MKFFYQRVYTHPIGYRNILLLIRKAINYKKYINLEESFPFNNNIIYHTVGERDCDTLIKVNPNISAKFIYHPHYKIIDKYIHFNKKIKILIAGRNDFYMHDSMQQALNVFYTNSILQKYYSITFLGKGWEKEHDKLSQLGYVSTNIQYVQNYIEEIIKYDIQLTAISVGVGTKGKVLDAFANGLLVIGNDLAIENINVQHNISCLKYSSPNELLKILLDIPSDIKYYESIAECGRNSVRLYHGVKSIKQFYSLIDN